MSEDRTYEIFAERRALSVDEDRALEIMAERRSFGIQEDQRVLEVLP